MMTALYPLLLEAALRALVAAAAVWGGLWLMRVANVLVLKGAWTLMLVAAVTLPLAPNWPALPEWAALRLPAIQPLSAVRQAAAVPATRPAAAIRSDAAFEPGPEIADAHSRPDRNATPSDSISRLGPTSLGPVGAPAIGDTSPVYARDAEPPAMAPTSTQLTIVPTAKTADATRIHFSVAALCLLLYTSIAVALLLRLIVGLATAIRLWMTAKPISIFTDPSWNVRFNERVASPVNIGSGIVLPIAYQEWDEEKLRIVLAHERSHIRQGDFYLQLLAGLYACIFWFSPLGWWLKRKLYELGEAISDRAGLEEATSRASYAQLLLEFAALPRPTLTGVAMARTSHLSQRIERLLNESSFKQAFAASSRKAVFAIAILVPLALVSATTLVTVQAATPTAQAQTDALTGQSTPEQVAEPAPPPAPAVVPEAAPAPEPAGTPEPMPAPPAPGSGNDMPAPPQPPAHAGDGMNIVIPHIDVNPHVHMDPQIAVMPPMPPMPSAEFRQHARELALAAMAGQNGDSFAVVGSDGKVSKPHGWFYYDEGNRQAEIEKARKQAHGAFLWFRHDGKSYFIDDPNVVSQVEAMNKPMDDLQSQMRDLGKQMREIGEQQRDKMREMRDTAVQTPDLSKELEALKTAEASLQAKQGGTITQKEIGDLQREIGRVQGQLGSLQGKLMMQKSGIDKNMGAFGAEQGKLGGQMGKLGSEMGRIARENQSKMDDIIKNSISNGKAKPVQ